MYYFNNFFLSYTCHTSTTRTPAHPHTPAHTHARTHRTHKHIIYITKIKTKKNGTSYITIVRLYTGTKNEARKRKTEKKHFYELIFFSICHCYILCFTKKRKVYIEKSPLKKCQ